MGSSGNNGTLQYPMGSKAVFVDGDAVRPRGSTWARNPIPRIWDSKKGLHNPEACPGPTTRAHPLPGCLAFPAPCPWDTYTKTGLLPCNASTHHDHGHNLPHRSEEELNGTTRCDGDGMGQCSLTGWSVSSQIMSSSQKTCLQGTMFLVGDGIAKRQPKSGRIVLMSLFLQIQKLSWGKA